MKRFTFRIGVGVFLAQGLMLSLAIAAPPAAPPIIGTVTAGGAFRLNGDTVMTNGTLTEGALLETGRGRSSVRLAGGARLTLNADSRGKLYSNHIVLEKGETGLENGVGFHLEVLGLTIHPVRGLSTGRVGLLGNNRVRVAALTGSFRVLNARGVLVANVAAGTAVAFEPQATPAATRITGTLTRQNGHFLLTDQVTRVTVEVTGPRLAGYVGQTVGVTGAANVASSSYQSASLVIASGQVQAVPAGAARSANTTSIVGGVAAVPEVGFTASGAPPVQAQASPPGGVPPGPPVTPPGQPPGRPPVTPPGPPTTPPGRPPDRPPVSPPGLSR